MSKLKLRRGFLQQLASWIGLGAVSGAAGLIGSSTAIPAAIARLPALGGDGQARRLGKINHISRFDSLVPSLEVWIDARMARRIAAVADKDGAQLVIALGASASSIKAQTIQSVRQKIAELYLSQYSDDELDDLVRFVDSPMGRKICATDVLAQKIFTEAESDERQRFELALTNLRTMPHPIL